MLDIFKIVILIVSMLASVTLAQNQTKATKWDSTIAEQRDASSQYDYALAYQNGVGVPQNIDTAIIWYRRAAEQDHKSAMYNLGQIHLHGGPIDAAEGAFWFQRAAKLGHIFAQHNLGSMYRSGSGVTQSNILAYMWFSIAAINGDELSTSSIQALEVHMPAIDIAKARRMLRMCMDSQYKNCEYSR